MDSLTKQQRDVFQMRMDLILEIDNLSQDDRHKIDYEVYRTDLVNNGQHLRVHYLRMDWANKRILGTKVKDFVINSLDIFTYREDLCQLIDEHKQDMRTLDEMQIFGDLNDIPVSSYPYLASLNIHLNPELDITNSSLNLKGQLQLIEKALSCVDEYIFDMNSEKVDEGRFNIFEDITSIIDYATSAFNQCFDIHERNSVAYRDI